MPSPPTTSRRHAVVIGASVGGMCAAEVLARHFERVTLIERDELTDDAELRRGVPQGFQPHGIQMIGRRELDRLFPGLMQALRAEGACEFDASLETAVLTPHGWAPRHDGIGATSFAGSRPLVERTMRRLLLARRPNVRLLHGTRVLGPIFERRGSAVWVTGVRTEDASGAADLAGDVVVDCTGRGSKVTQWLRTMGLPLPTERRVDPKSNYASRHYRAPPEAGRWWWKALIVLASPPRHPRAGTILTVEGGRWIVTAVGTNGDYAPTDERGWLDYLASLRSSALVDLVRRAEPLTDIVQNRSTANVWRLMHLYDGSLNGLLLFGDAVCGFNPSYGQGLTAAALAAKALDGTLAERRGQFDRHFLRAYYREQSDFLDQGWTFSTSQDFRWENTVGDRPPLQGVADRVLGFVERVVVHDSALMRRALPLLDFGGRRRSLLAPEFVGRALRGLAREAIAPPRLPWEIDLTAPPPGPR